MAEADARRMLALKTQKVWSSMGRKGPPPDLSLESAGGGGALSTTAPLLIRRGPESSLALPTQLLAVLLFEVGLHHLGH
jgi:hypothetical protein